MDRVKQFMKKNSSFLILVFTPIIFAPILGVIENKYPEYTMESRTAYGIVIIAIYWVTEATDLAVTSLLPLLIFPFLGVLKAKVVCMEYMKDTNILLLGGLLIAVAIEKWNVHKRVALAVLLLVGTQPRRLMLGFMVTTAFISMWVTNTATTAMMVPIMEAVLKQLDNQYLRGEANQGEELHEVVHENTNHHTSNGHVGPVSNGVIASTATVMTEMPLDSKHELNSLHSNDHHSHQFNAQKSTSKKPLTTEIETKLQAKKVHRHKLLCKAMLLSICYSANIGGTGTLTGTTPQLVLQGQVDSTFKDAPSISFIYWFVYAFPQMLLFLFIEWLYLQAMFIGIGFKHLCCCFRWKKRNTRKGKAMYAVMKQQYKDLGPITYAQGTILVMFIFLVILWLFRQPKFMGGWGDAFKKGYISDGTSAMIIAFLIFQLPSQIPDALNYFGIRKDPSLPPKILDWKETQKKFPWNVLFLLGAGFAIAKACEESGLSLLLSCKLAGLKAIPGAAIVFIICTMLTFLTEITSNTATATILLPVLASLAQSIEVHPFYLLIPAAVCASFAFMLPVATPPNAIVFSTGRLTVIDMAKAGFGMNVIGILVVTLAINTWGSAYYELGPFPSWASVGNATNRC